jgi:hypothetical protein
MIQMAVHKLADVAPEKSSRTLAQEAFFLDFAHEIRKHFPKLILMVTGGFRTRAGMEAAISNGSCDLIGIGRPAAINPMVPKLILDKGVPAEEADLHLNKLQAPFIIRILGLKILTAGAETVSCIVSTDERKLSPSVHASGYRLTDLGILFQADPADGEEIAPNRSVNGT